MADRRDGNRSQVAESGLSRAKIRQPKETTKEILYKSDSTFDDTYILSFYLNKPRFTGLAQ